LIAGSGLHGSAAMAQLFGMYVGCLLMVAPLVWFWRRGVALWGRVRRRGRRGRGKPRPLLVQNFCRGPVAAPKLPAIHLPQPTYPVRPRRSA
jgi:hypothetical protein